MDLRDPTTGQALPSDAIQRILFVANTVHVYNIPPLASMRGHSATSWTADPSRHIFTGRLRVVETSTERPGAADSGNDNNDSDEADVKIALVLEDANSGSLFAAAPYTDRGVVEPVIDSSRFFAVTVRDPQGRKAVLGIGFEERSEAFDLSVSLQEARRSLGWDIEQAKQAAAASAKTETKDYSLKEGETITVNLGGSKFGRRRPQPSSDTGAPSGPADLQSFALAPPPPPSQASTPLPGAGFAIPPPPPTDKKTKRRSIRDLGFDDGQFGEFA